MTLPAEAVAGGMPPLLQFAEDESQLAFVAPDQYDVDAEATAGNNTSTNAAKAALQAGRDADAKSRFTEGVVRAVVIS
jgi:hypothetical protein